MVYNCSNPNCARTWNGDEDEFPLCITNPCPLRQVRNELISRRGVSWKPKSQFVNKETPMLITSAKGSLETIRSDTIRKHKKAKFHPYNMQGAQKATTKVTLRNGTVKSFSTKDNMHSEMAAIQWMLDNGFWVLYLGNIIWSDNLSPVSSDEFQTTEPHCGFCSVMLAILGLPLSKPTKGNYNMACNFNYPLPKIIKEDPYVLARLLSGNSYCGFNKIKAILNSLVNIEKDKWVLSIQNLAFVNENHYVDPQQGVLTLDWLDVIKQSNGEVLNQIWRLVFECLYKTNDGSVK